MNLAIDDQHPAEMREYRDERSGVGDPDAP
jgi:hypothetical protein